MGKKLGRNTLLFADKIKTELQLSQGKSCWVDSADYALIQDYRWRTLSTKGKFYVIGRKIGSHWRSPNTLLHRFLTGATGAVDVDHIDGNGLNNSRVNMRICSRSLNMCNRTFQLNSKSKIKGVSWSTRNKGWQAHICLYGKREYLGTYKDKRQAQECYNKRAAILHGEFSKVPAL